MDVLSQHLGSVVFNLSIVVLATLTLYTKPFWRSKHTRDHGKPVHRRASVEDDYEARVPLPSLPHAPAPAHPSAAAQVPKAKASPQMPRASASAGNPAFWVRVAVTTAVLLSGLFVILSKNYDSEQQKWAFGAIGTIVGYWLKG